MPHVTLNMVARKAGVSKTTASLVLNGKADRLNIASGTQERVKQIAKELNYQPGHFNPGRLNGKTGIIGVVASQFSSYPNNLWFNHVVTILQLNKYVAIPILLREETRTLNNIVAADGYLLLDEKAVSLFEKVKNSDTKAICCGFQTEKEDFKCIHPNWRDMVNEMVAALYQYNRKAIGLVTKDSQKISTQTIINTYRENYCDRFDIQENICYISENQYTSEAIAKACMSLVDKGVNGVIFESGDMVQKALLERNIRQLLTTRKVLFACYGERPEFNVFEQDGLLIIPENIEAMAQETVNNVLKKTT
ncbi:LacI family DNA-binding transcriptional regulator [Thermophagus xiamenensis]|uniref:DNA-binding transcriptional regulator, LacI/PurR family n=1 Tax=Thermophagus xiamenensis TaxID=385682 RepID=A0A1I1XZP9_9BACT|nr:LacI family DNA-binding transcriptional regulator [Thermophagus xiamenensis]SFE12781.1 DNA-binding transcriptional regulator, LacI/PurR family [Thermophagus xiamenensis]